MPKTAISMNTLGLCLLLAGCVGQQPEEPVKVVEANEQRVIVEGPVDKTRSTPPDRFTTVAQERCAKFDREAELQSVTSTGTWGSRMIYACVP
jgi:hypothetical protein